MTGRDPKLDALLTAAPEAAWSAIFTKLWEVFSAPLTAPHVERDVTDRERHLFRQLRDISRFRPRVKDRTTQ